jgi:Trypsin/Tachylectin
MVTRSSEPRVTGTIFDGRRRVVTKPKRPSARARIIIGTVAALTVVAGAAYALPSTASAGEVPTAQSNIGYAAGKDPAKSVKGQKILKKLPEGARRVNHSPGKPGKRARTFDAKTASPRIVGGSPVNSTDYPSVVGIETFFLYDSDGDGFLESWVSTCTGTVLSPTRVLTASHCTVDFNYGFTQVIAGRNNIDVDTNGFVARVASTWTEPTLNYEAMLGGAVPRNDVSVLTLKDALPAAYVPVTLAAQGAADPADGTDATIAGYGITSGNASDSGILRAATVPIKSDATCTTAWGSDFDPTGMMCAGIPSVADTCHGDSGGPIFTGTATARVQVGITDWGSSLCDTNYGVYSAINHYSDDIKAQITALGSNNLDWTGDGHSDLIARVRDTGDLWVASGAGFSTNTYGGLSGLIYGITSSNWNSFSKLFRVNNWSGDGIQSVFARDSAGRLYNYRSDGMGDFAGGAPLQIGSGWNTYTDIMVTNDWVGNGLPNLIGRTSAGKLVLYNADGHGGWLNPRGTQIGTGWSRFNTVLTPGSWLGDGHQSLIGRTPSGQLWLYNSNGNGGWTNPQGTQIGSGWAGFPTFLSPGDWSGDNLVDLMGVNAAGDLRLYTTNGHGSWLNSRGTVVDTGWNMFNTIF